jgi:hypothetical protein
MISAPAVGKSPGLAQCSRASGIRLALLSALLEQTAPVQMLAGQRNPYQGFNALLRKLPDSVGPSLIGLISVTTKAVEQSTILTMIKAVRNPAFTPVWPDRVLMIKPMRFTDG